MRRYLGSLVIAAGLSAACAAGVAADEAKDKGDAKAAVKDEVKSGPQAGDPFAGAFNVKGVTGEAAGETLCFT